MRRFYRFAAGFAVALVMAGLPLDTLGQGLSDFEFTIFGGGSVFTNESFEIGPPQSPTPIPFDFDVGGGFTGGFRLNIITANVWGLEPYYSYTSATASYVQADDPTYRLDLPIQVHNISLSFLWYPMGNGYPFADNRKKITPYVVAGGGASIFRPTSEAKDIANDPLQGNLPEIIESSKASFHYGAGIKWRFTREMDLRADVRGTVSGIPTFGLPTSSSDPNASVIPVSGLIQQTEFTVGWGLNFGSRP